MLTEDQLTQIIKGLILTLLDQQERHAALWGVLKRRDLVSYEEYWAALQAVKKDNQEQRSRIEQIGDLDPLEILRGFEGPVQ